MAIIGVLIGLIIPRGNNSPSTSAPVASMQMPADDGKLAQSYKEKVIVKTIRDNAKDLQTCYFTLLDKKPSVSEGELVVLFKVEENGEISSVKVTKNDFNDSDFGDCISKKLATYYLTPPPLGINRYISHSLAFKSEETAEKEAKERAEKSKPPKVLPVK